MQKRILAFILIFAFAFTLSACKGNNEITPSDAQGSERAARERSNLFGFLVQDGEKNHPYEAMHSFLVTCEDLGVNAKLYRFSTDDELKACTDEAIKDDCDAVLFYSADVEITDSINAVKKQNRACVSLINENESCDCSVVLSDNTTEILSLLSEKTEGGTVLLYSSIVVNATQFTDGDVKVKTFTRTEYSYKAAQKSLKDFLLLNTDIKAIYAIGTQNARPAHLAAKEIGGIKVIGEELSDINNGLFEHGLYGLCVTPYYEMTAKAVYAMQKLTDGESVSEEYCTKHLVTRDKLEKYQAIRKNAENRFKG